MTISRKTIGVIITVILVPLAISLIANYTTWFGTRQITEVTLRLAGWIAVGSTGFGDLPGLRLMLNSEPIESVVKVSWTVTNTGNKGIASFESGPSLVFPAELQVVRAVISDASPLLHVSRALSIKRNRATIDSLGIFNAGNFMKVDIYIKNVPAGRITEAFFNDWKLEANALDLSVKKDISNAPKQARKRQPLSALYLWGFYFLCVAVMFIGRLMIKLFAKLCWSKRDRRQSGTP